MPLHMDVQESVDGTLGFHVVAIGASAGGLEALEGLFERMPTTTGLAFVVLQHLSPDFESHMDELLRRKTSIAVHRVTNGMQVEPNAIYLIPPRKEMIISGGRLLLTEKDPDRGLTLPIDVFFRSLANDQGPFSVGIVLSGTGSDGSRGIRAIHEAGGLVICQTEDTAKFDGMPRAALQTGVVDLVMAPREMPDALTAHACDSPTGLVGASPKPLQGMDRVFQILREAHGIDFAHYKASTVVRRIERRLQLVSAADLDEYVARILTSTAERESLYRDLLIGVTRFFRDGQAFEELERHVIPAILAESNPREELRVWVEACATGEEAYSLAMLFHEQLAAADRAPRLKIFATDVHRASLDVASVGMYEEAALADVSPERLARYFVRKNDRYQVGKELRQLIVFAPHNVIADAPFTHLDLVTCRNLLIYLQPAAQKKAVSLFHFGLKTRGFLFLGPSESPGEIADEFDAVDTRWKIYRKRRDIRLPATIRLPVLTPPTTRRRPLDLGWSETIADAQLLSIYDRLLSNYVPNGLLVDDRQQLLHTFAGAEKYLRVPTGRPSNHLLELIVPELKTAVSGALGQAAKKREVVRFSGIPVRGENGERSYRLQVMPLADDRTKSTSYLVTIEPLGDDVRPPEDTPLDVGQMSRDRIEALEGDLRFTKESLQASIEELETSNEELQATNEELVASNEELQSTNEELHSVNEELYTVNGELQSKIAELTETTADLDSVLETTEVGVLFLDKELRIRKFTPKIVQVFQLLPQDVGRPIEAFQHKLDDPQFVEEVRHVLATGLPVEHDVEAEGGRAYYLRILPYRQAGRVAGVVVTLLDVGALRHAERMLRAIVESSVDAIIACGIDGVITHWNPGAERMYGHGAADMIGRPLDVIVPEDRRHELAEILGRVAAGEQLEHIETLRRHKDGTLLHVSLQISPLRAARGEVVAVSAIERDITSRKRAEEEVRHAVAQRERFLAILSHELRNPLAAVVSAASLLRKDEVARELRTRALAVLQRQATHMAHLLDDLLDISRIRQGKLELRQESVDLRHVVEAALETVAAPMEERGCRVIAQLGDEPIPMVADPHRLRQLIVNILTNAIRHTPAGRSVTLTVENGESRTRLRVRDEGSGIAPDVLTRIFEPFGAAGAPGRRTGSLGIGLWIVRSIAEAHGGAVTIHSGGVGRGTEVVVELPLSAKVAPLGSSTSIEPIDAHVLLVEDQRDLQELLEAILAGAGLTVRTADSAERALELLGESVPEVAVVDIGLPGMSGLDFAAQIRTHYGKERVRLVALTGFGQQADRQAVYEAGFDRHLVKPVDLDVLIAAIRREAHTLRGRTGDG